ncbi:MAG TPA: CopG family ribbon-helix-helix protein [Candidatus Lokiarchaeia archaeon]|nr:CopG family ribbon-helix-helix protein [Candidatus Lokiarchaeia archaeon]
MYSEKDMDRITVTIPKNFLAEFERYCKEHGTKRSEVVRDALREFLKNEATKRPESFEDGFLIIAFNHHQHGLLDELTELEHNAGIELHSTMHVHVSEENCAEVISLHGRVKEVMIFVEQVKALKGILFCELVPLYIFPSEDGGDHSGQGHVHED